jgi:hypothetical protein
MVIIVMMGDAVGVVTRLATNVKRLQQTITNRLSGISGMEQWTVIVE